MWQVRKTVLALALLAGCPGTTDIPRGDGPGHEGWRPPDLLKIDAIDGGLVDVNKPGDTTTPEDTSSGCAPEDAISACDPIKPSGCPQGAGCYIVHGTKVDCVCPAGTVPIGGACNTTTECLPGHGCVGETPPGTCRRVCDPKAPVCAAGETCKLAASAQQYGLCVP
jgi:hypothetical protein